MKLKRIEIKAFGVLEDFTLDFAPNGGAFYALNESGKSTCLTFIRCAFYGMPERQRKLVKNLRKRYMPFNQSSYGGAIIFEHEGRDYRLTRRFGASKAGDRTELRDEKLKDVISLDDPDAPGLELLGIEEGAFLNTVFVAQMDVPYSKEQDRDGALLKKLTELGSSGDETSSITSLRDDLTEAERQLNSEQRKDSFIPNLQEKIYELEDEERLAIEKRDEIDQLTQRYSEQKLKLERTEVDLQRLRNIQGFVQKEDEISELQSQESKQKEQMENLKALEKKRHVFEAREGFDKGAGLRDLAGDVSSLRSLQDGQKARWSDLEDVPKELGDEKVQALATVKQLRHALHEQQSLYNQSQNDSDKLQGEIADLEQERDKLLAQQSEAQESASEELKRLETSLREAEKAERKAHDAMTELDKKVQVEGFQASKDFTKYKKKYGKPLMKSVHLTTEIQTLMRKEVHILRELEGKASPHAEEKQRALAEFMTERFTFMKNLEDPPEDLELEEEDLQNWRRILNPSSEDETLDDGNEQSEENPVASSEESDVEANLAVSSEDSDVEEERDNDNIEQGPQEFLADTSEINLEQLSQEGQHLEAERARLSGKVAELQTTVEKAGEKEQEAERDYLQQQAIAEHENKSILHVKTPSRAKLIALPIVIVLFFAMGIFSGVLMFKQDFLFLILTVISFVVAGVLIHFYAVERKTLTLAQEAEAQRIEALRAQKLADEKHDAFLSAGAELQRKEEERDKLTRELEDISRAWENRIKQETFHQKELRELATAISAKRNELEENDRDLPILSQTYRDFAESYKKNQKEREEALEKARAEYKKQKEALDNIVQQQAETKEEIRQAGETKEALELQKKLDALASEIKKKESHRFALRTRRHGEKAEMEANLHAADFADEKQLEERFEELKSLKQQHETKRQTAEAQRKTLSHHFLKLQEPWQKLLQEGQRFFEDDLWADLPFPYHVSEESLTKKEALEYLNGMARQLDRLEAAVDQKLDQYRSLCVEIKSLKSQIPSETELTEQQEKLKTLQGEAQDLKEDLKDPEVDTAELDKELSEARNEQEKLNSMIQKKELEVEDLRAEIVRLETTLKHEIENAKSPEELKRQRQAVEEQLAYRKLQLAALQLTRQCGEKAFKKMREQFSPKLQTYASEYLAQITNGRYTQLAVKSEKNDLVLEVDDADYGGLMPGEYLSGGAYEQIYLALRLAMTRLLDPDKKLPLLLDDLLIQFDIERQNSTLELLDQITQEGRQIVYFTCSKDMAERIDQQCADWVVKPLLGK